MDHEEGLAATGRRFRLARQLVLDAAVHVERLRVVLVFLHLVTIDRHSAGRGRGGGSSGSGGRSRGTARCHCRVNVDSVGIDNTASVQRRRWVAGSGNGDCRSNNGGAVETGGCRWQHRLPGHANADTGRRDDSTTMMMMMKMMVMMMMTVVSMSMVNGGTYHHFLLITGGSHVVGCLLFLLLLLSGLPPARRRPFLHSRR